MFFPNKNQPRLPEEKKSAKPISPSAKKRLLVVLMLSFLLLFIYYGCVGLGYAKPIMIIYFVAFAAIIVTYLAYNRGFVNKDVTADMLPDDWSAEKKQAFVAAEKARAEKSRWMLTVIIPFLVVFMCEALYLFVWDSYLANYFKG